MEDVDPPRNEMETLFSTRDFEQGDYARLSEILHSVYPEYHRSPEELRFEDEMFDRKKFMLKRYSVVEPDHEDVVATGEYRHNPTMFHPQKFQLGIFVDHSWQHRGIGSSLYDRVIEDLKGLKAITVRLNVREDKFESISFLEKRGFKERMRAWESRLPVQEFDQALFERYPEKIAELGVKISTLSEQFQHEPDYKRKVHELALAIAPDVPAPDRFTGWSFEDTQKYLRDPDILPDGFFIARDGDRYVGMSDVFKREKEPEDLYQQLTGVLREYRGRGIAMALKLRVIDFAKRHGAKVIKTWNDSTNTPMLAINIKLGFQRRVGWITFEKLRKLASAARPGPHRTPCPFPWDYADIDEQWSCDAQACQGCRCSPK